MNKSRIIKNLLKGFIDIVYPPLCIVCKNKLTGYPIEAIVCGQCRGRIRKNLPPFCLRCGRQLKAPYYTKSICGDCVRKKLHFDRAFSPCIYEGVIKELIYQFKYNGKDYLGPDLSRLMTAFMQEYEIAMDVIDYIIPIPLFSTKLREREFNQSELLSRHIAKEFNNTAVLVNALVRNRHTATQTDLTPEKRLENVKDSFTVPKKETIIGKNILLVDDVLTTGATASEAALALKQAGAGIVFVATLAN